MLNILFNFNVLLIKIVSQLKTQINMKITTHCLTFKTQKVRRNLLLHVAVFGLAFSWQTQAQTGDTCDDAIEITALPFSDSGNTSDYGNN